jgi:hypothetical protein
LLASLVLAGCGGAATSPSTSPTASPTPSVAASGSELLGLAGETTSPFPLSGPYSVEGRLGSSARKVRAVAVPSTGLAAVSALALALNVPGPPISTPTGLGYNLGATSGYQLTTDASLTTFNFHPNTPTDEVGITPTVAIADQFAEQFLAACHVPADGGVIPLPQLTNSHGSDRTVYFQWTLEGLPVVNILGQPQEFFVDVATNRTETEEVVGISGAIPYGATGNPRGYSSMKPYQAVQDLNSGVIRPRAYLLSPSGQPFPTGSSAAGGGVSIESMSLAMVYSYGTAVPVYLFQVSAASGPTQFVTCAVPPTGCVPLRFRNVTPSPSPSASG